MQLKGISLKLVGNLRQTIPFTHIYGKQSIDEVMKHFQHIFKQVHSLQFPPRHVKLRKIQIRIETLRNAQNNSKHFIAIHVVYDSYISQNGFIYFVYAFCKFLCVTSKQGKKCTLSVLQKQTTLYSILYDISMALCAYVFSSQMKHIYIVCIYLLCIVQRN